MKWLLLLISAHCKHSCICARTGMADVNALNDGNSGVLKRYVIVGGGIAGVSCAEEVSTHTDNNTVSRVTLYAL